MNPTTHQYRHLLPSGFHADSKVWIYQSNRFFNDDEAEDVNKMLETFVAQWTSHGSRVKGFGQLFFSKFIVMIADESQAGVSGCSTDSSVKLIKEIEALFDVNLFGREQLAFLVNDNIIEIPVSEIQQALKNNLITPDTFYFNNLTSSKIEFETNWIIKLKFSWLKNKFI